MSPRHKKYQGFTLIEVLISITIFAVVSVAVYSVFAGGMNVWRRTKEVDIAERRFFIQAEKICRDLRQAFFFADAVFYGSKEKIQFAGIVDSQVARITYYFDAAGKRILRGYNKLPEIIEAKKDKPEGEETLEPKLSPYLNNIQGFNAAYLYFDAKYNAYIWKDEWEEKQALPKAVKINIIFNQNKEYAAVIFIPVA